MSAERVAAVPIDVFVVGAMKAATTGLCEWLDAQPGLALSQPKEPSIFVSEESVASWTPRLDTLFPDAAEGDLRVDGSTDYAKHPAIDGVPERVARACPDAKIVYLLRHPVDRLLSQYRFEWYLGAEKRALAQELSRNPQLVANSRYAEQLSRWLTCFDADRIILVFAEAFMQRPEVEVQRVLDFLGVSNTELFLPARERANQTSELVRPTLARRIYRRSKTAKRLRPLVPAPVVARYRRRLERGSEPELTPDLMRELENAFDEDLHRLTGLTGGPVLTCQNWHETALSWTPRLISP